MTEKLKKAAYDADSRSKRCSECSLQPCRPAVYRACTLAFIEGFRKGAEYQKQQSKTSKK